MRRDRGRPSGEFALIARLIAKLPRGRGTVIGPGDDAAVVRPGGGDLVITTDAIVEGRHFARAWGRLPALRKRLAEAVGSRLAAANVSDLAAMGARPRWAVLSAGIRADGAARLVRSQRALARALARAGAALVGGNLCRVSGPEWLSLTLIGELRRGRVLARDGARAGDWIAVTGAPGRAGSFARLANAGRMNRALAAAWVNPRSRASFAAALAEGRLARAAIDLSDGLAADLSHLARASGVSAELDACAWPTDAALAAALAPSDDYELILAIAPARRARVLSLAHATRTPLAWIGRFQRGSAGAVFVRSEGGSRRRIVARGFDHFARASRQR